MSELNDLQDTILQITEEINQMALRPEPRKEGDVDIFQLMRAWQMSDTAVRRRMKLVGKQPEKTGFRILSVYDPNRRHEVLVLRKVIE